MPVRLRLLSSWSWMWLPATVLGCNTPSEGVLIPDGSSTATSAADSSSSSADPSTSATTAMSVDGSGSSGTGVDTTATGSEGGSTSDGTTSSDGTSTGPSSTTTGGTTTDASTGGTSTGDVSTSTGNTASTGGSTGGGEPVCGNGVIEVGEDCDDVGDSASCDADCTFATCGDGHANAAAGEACDDGDLVDGDGCDSDCTPSSVVAIGPGGQHTCVLLDTATVRCWGEASLGELGYANTDDIGDDELPSAVGTVDIGGVVTQLAAGYNHNCVLLDDGNVRCWGQGQYAQLGYGNPDAIGDGETPATAGDVDVGGFVLQLVTGYFHTCALLDNGDVRCWGAGPEGELGLGFNAFIGDNELPSSVDPVDVGGNVTQIVTGFHHTCVLLDGGDVRCWGDGAGGRLGYGNTDVIGDNEVPSAVGTVSVGGTVTQLAAGGTHTCAILDGGDVRCWGVGGLGQLGYGNTDDIGDNELPSSVGPVDLGAAALQIATGFLHTCALLDGGDVRCWGLGDYGGLGYGNTEEIGDTEVPSSVGPVNVGGSVARIGVTNDHVCALLDGGGLRCWGLGVSGRLGYDGVANIGDDELPVTAGDVVVF